MTDNLSSFEPISVRKSQSDVGVRLKSSLSPSSGEDLRQAHSLGGNAPTEKRLDKFGFILNMDSNGDVYEDSLEEDRVPSFAETKLKERRVKKWNVMMQSWDTTTRNRRKLLHKRLRKGVPDSMRGNVWPLLRNVPKMIQKHVGLYEKLVRQATNVTSEDRNNKKESRDAGQSSVRVLSAAEQAVMHSRSFRQTQETIERDIHRTYPRHHMFHEESTESDDDILDTLDDGEVSDLIAELEGTSNGKLTPISEKHPAIAKGGQASLRRVLRAYSVYDREVGYCQGMNFIAGMFLTFMPEEESFWLLVAVMNDPPCRMRGLFGEGMRETHQVLHVAEKLTQKFLPKLAKHMERENVHVTMYATQWLLTLYTSSFPFDLVTRVWDCFLAEGWKVVYRVMLALLQQSVSDLMQLSFEDILAYFRDLPEHVDANSIMETALKIPLRRKHIEKFEKEWLSREQQ